MEIKVTGGTMPQEEIDRYVEKIKQKNPDKLFKSITLHIDGEYVDVSYDYDSKPFHRIRRITGYLVGDLGRFNNAKRSEVNDRVKHAIGSNKKEKI